MNPILRTAILLTTLALLTALPSAQAATTISSTRSNTFRIEVVSDDGPRPISILVCSSDDPTSVCAALARHSMSAIKAGKEKAEELGLCRTNTTTGQCENGLAVTDAGAKGDKSRSAGGGFGCKGTPGSAEESCSAGAWLPREVCPHPAVVCVERS